MLIRSVADSSHERVIDRSLLCELLHPDKVPEATGLGCSIAHAIVPAGESTLPHVLDRSVELYYILEGKGEIHIGDEQASVRAGQIVYIPPGARQFIRNCGTEDLVFLCIVSPKWQASDERLIG
ncbi:cupin domain-containing protein [Methanoregula formicica]|uniref:Mannose-6-phosphate isomerase n=1 Tax=Methanoregula formicica (strain DSM 22288 / NBRC 105244 / SMSP) TaxID=593750 RepID=L0H9A9_METFS|nr:cupin domain-containing protein [Methanoregula formicica]AGB01322.1 mannose-6-phosphate isomerase [Methanoregula formicica SMSP]